jgi:KipI family sensor histidine kinase inhibitor
VLLRFGTKIDLQVNERVLDFMHVLDNTPPLMGIHEVLPAYASLLVHYDPLVTTSKKVQAWCRQASVDSDTAGQQKDAKTSTARVVEIPVRYGGKYGPDLEEAAAVVGMSSPNKVAEAHASGDYRVYFLGFTGGFPYMGGLPESLSSVPRLSTPRQSVPRGAVGIAAGQTGVYTLSSPGGWHLLGRTTMSLFDPSANPPSALQPGDRVRFVPTVVMDNEEEDENREDEDKDEDEDEDEENSVVPNAYVSVTPCLEVIAPGPMTTVQDLGRRGYGRHGVSRSGAADGISLRLANSLVKNNVYCAGLEVAMGGLQLKCVERPVVVALTGADCGAMVSRGMLPGAPPERILVNQTVSLRPDDILSMGYAKDGARGYVAVSNGGVDVPVVLGSKSTDVRAKLGGVEGRTLRVGDILGYEGSGSEGLTTTATAPMKAKLDPLEERRQIANRNGSTDKSEWILRVLTGPGHPEEDNKDDSVSKCLTLNRMLKETFTVTPRADRMAVVASLGEAPTHDQEKEMQQGGDDEEANENNKLTAKEPLSGGQQMSEACVSGTIQVPPDGNPVILLAEHQTTGGYNIPGVVVEADLWKVGQMRPGDTLRFDEVQEEEARRALRDIQATAEDVEVKVMTGKNIDMIRLSGGINQLGNATKYGRDEEEESQYGLAMSEFEGKAQRRNRGEGRGRERGRGRGREQERGRQQRRKSGVLPTLSHRNDLSTIDLNADCGEGFDDQGLLQYVTSINVACGGHVGDPISVARTIRHASEAGVSIGAHPSFVDHDGFGRTALDTIPLELRDQILWQVGALQGLCSQTSDVVSYIKPHGALYHAVMKGGKQGEAVYEAAAMLDLPLLLMPQSIWATYGEGFAERAYDGNLLRPRELDGAVIHDPLEAARQAVELASKPNIHTICVHGDSPNAVNVAKAVRDGLEKANYVLKPFVN